MASEGALHVVLVHPEIHWNTGNAGRTCLAAGAQLHLIRPLGFALDDRSLRRAGLDYWPRVAPVVWESWPVFAAGVPGLGEPFLLSADGERTLYDVTFPPCTVLIFGRESVGLPDDVRRCFPERALRIPVAGGSRVRSLNLSTAVAVAVYEVVRQRRGPGADLSCDRPPRRDGPG